MTTTNTLVARDLLNTSHPLHGSLKAFCGEKEITLRQARKFLQHHQSYRKVAAA